MRVIHSLVPGSAAWHQHRAKCFNASEAAAAAGLSKYMKRSDLIRIKATGVIPEVNADTQRLFDKGHRGEAAVKPHIAELLGEDIFPITASLEVDGMTLSASYDGLTFGEDVVVEVKLWNDALAERARTGELEPHYWFQLEQQLLIVGAERAIFVVTREDASEFVSMEYFPVPGRREQVIAAWKQFAQDVQNYSPAAAAAEVKAAPVESLPAVLVQMKGELSVTSNLEEFGGVLKAFIAKLPKQPTTDTEFATADMACKALARAEKDLKSEEDRALAGMSSVESMRRLVADLHKTARDTRLALEKLVDKRKRDIKESECKRGEDAVLAHIRQRNEQLGGEFLPLIERNFPGCIARLKNFDSLRGAIDDHVAETKIKVDAHFAVITQNLTWLRANAAELKFLFSDVKSLVLKTHEDFTTLSQARIDNHKADVARKEAAARERIRAEEAARLEREATARAREESARQLEQQRQATAATPAPTAAPSTVVQATFAAPLQPEKPALQLVPAGPPSLNLGRINERIAPLGITVAGLEKLGFPPAAQVGASKMYHAADFDRMVRAMAEHLMHSTVDKVDAA